jgi:predicted nicotinamide N-methyase
MDGLHLTSTPLVPEVRLFLAEDPTILWARLEADAGHRLPAPFWASAWSGGQALARYVLDNPAVVAGQDVLDLASGSGMVAIAAALAGARTVTANDIDPHAAVAIAANARANGVRVELLVDDLLDGGDPGEPHVVLAGDALYNEALSARVLSFLGRVAERGARVLVGDPDRGWLPGDAWQTVETYRLGVAGVGEDAQLEKASVIVPRAVAGPVPRYAGASADWRNARR